MRLIFSFILLFSHTETFALTQDQVLQSTADSYPLILESLAKRKSALGKLQASQGVFDLSINGKADTRPRGFYDGKTYDFTLNKSLSTFNSELYLGYKNSQGEYPDYEGKVNTLDEGELRAGVKVSLWKNRDIDLRRLKILQNKINLSNADFKIFETRVKIQKIAIQTYRKWVASLKVLNIYKELLAIAKKRDRGLRKRVKQGDLAAIYLVENQQYILKWQRSLLVARNVFQESSLSLSLFYRNSDGKPIVPAEKEVSPPKVDQIKIDNKMLKTDLARSMNLNPKLKFLTNQIESFSYDEKIGKNSLRPKLDISFEMSRDAGEGSSTLVETENRAMLSINIPLQTNEGRGKIRAARANKKVVYFQRKLATEKAITDLNKLMNNINVAVDLTSITETEITLAKKLRSAEYQKFDKGDSDFFVLNLREQNLASAQIDNIKAEFEYFYSLAEYEANTFKLLEEKKE